MRPSALAARIRSVFQRFGLPAMSSLRSRAATAPERESRRASARSQPGGAESDSASLRPAASACCA